MKTINYTKNKNEYIFLYIVKIIAAFLVSWGHFLGAGTWQTGYIDGVIKSIPNGTSLLPPNTQSLWRSEAFFVSLINVESAIIGVVLFFFSSGFLIPQLQEKYNRNGNMPLLIFKRLGKLYPVTFVCVSIVGLIVYLSQGIKFSIRNYIDTALVCGTFTGKQMTIGVIWYLLVLVFLYIICTIVPKISLRNLSYVYGILYLFVVLPATLSDYPQCWIFINFEYVAKFCGIPLLGTAVYLLKDEESICRKVVDTIWFFSLSFFLLKLDHLLYGTEHTYTNLWTYIVSFLIVFLSVILAHFCENNPTVVCWLC